jgi:GT2 family glycosyltransferase
MYKIDTSNPISDNSVPGNIAASIIIPTYRRFSYVLDTVDSLLKQSRRDIEIIVADQNISWPSEFLDRLHQIKTHPQVKWLRFEKLGVVNARHEAVSRSAGEVLVFVDDDVLIEDVDFVHRHLVNYGDETVDAVVGRELVGLASQHDNTVNATFPCAPEADFWKTRTLVEQTISFPRDSRARVDVCCFCTCNSSVRKSSFFKVGGFDEGFRGASYGDDFDFAIRLAQAGGRIVFDPACELIHLKAPMGGLRLSDPRNNFTEKEKALSGLVFVLRHGRAYSSGSLFYRWVLRRTILLKRNVSAPWRLLSVTAGLISALWEARRIVARGPISRFSGEGQI